MSKRGHHKTEKTNKILLPIILLMGFVPLIVHMYTYNPNLSQFEWFPDGVESQNDFFFGWKMVAIIVIGIIMIGVLLYQYLKNKSELRFENSFYFLFCYIMFVAMSALFSKYKYWVAHGTYELFEPIWVVLVYVILCYYTYNYITSEKELRHVLSGVEIGMLIVALIGAFQYFGIDFFKTDFAKHIITNSSWWNQLNDLDFNVGDRTSYTTLYNPNFLSFYFGMFVPLIICLIIAARKWWQRIVLVVSLVLCLICLKGSGSATGWMSIVLAAIILIFVLLSRKRKRLYVAITSMFILILFVLGFGKNITQEIKAEIVGTYHMDEKISLKDIQINDDDVVFNIRDHKLYVSYEMDSDGIIHVYCKNKEETGINLTLVDEANQIYSLDNKLFERVFVQPFLWGSQNLPAVSVWIDGYAWDFVNISGEGYYYANPAGKLVKDFYVGKTDFFADDAMSSRGHIWNLTIPLLGKHILIGSGANTYLFEYPQNDYIYQAYVIGPNNYNVKAHCWYLQQWVENGLFGTIFLLIFILFYLAKSIRIYRRVDLHESISWVGFGLFAAVLVYLIVGIANDSNVCTAPVFWGMLGLGLATNRIIEERTGNLNNAEVGADKMTEREGTDAKEEIKEKNSIVCEKQQSTKKLSRKQRKNQKK